MRLPSICIKATYLFVKSGKMYSISVNIRLSKNYKFYFSLSYLLPILLNRDTAHNIINKIDYISSQHILLNNIQKTIKKITYTSGI